MRDASGYVYENMIMQKQGYFMEKKVFGGNACLIIFSVPKQQKCNKLIRVSNFDFNFIYYIFYMNLS